MKPPFPAPRIVVRSNGLVEPLPPISDGRTPVLAAWAAYNTFVCVAVVSAWLATKSLLASGLFTFVAVGVEGRRIAGLLTGRYERHTALRRPDVRIAALACSLPPLSALGGCLAGSLTWG